MRDCWTPAEAHRGALAHQRTFKASGQPLFSMVEARFRQITSEGITAKALAPPVSGGTSRGISAVLGAYDPTTNPNMQRASRPVRPNEGSGPRSCVCLRKASGHLSHAFFCSFHLSRHFVWEVMEPLSPFVSMVERFRDQPIGSQISEENPAFTRMKAGTATKLLWRERKKLRKTNMEQRVH